MHTLYEFVDEEPIQSPVESPSVILCTSCRKEPAEVAGLCIGCDHLMDDLQIQLDRAAPTTNRRTT